MSTKEISESQNIEYKSLKNSIFAGENIVYIFAKIERI
jgi:hypothetical protein